MEAQSSIKNYTTASKQAFSCFAYYMHPQGFEIIPFLQVGSNQTVIARSHFRRFAFFGRGILIDKLKNHWIPMIWTGSDVQELCIRKKYLKIHFSNLGLFCELITRGKTKLQTPESLQTYSYITIGWISWIWSTHCEYYPKSDFDNIIVRPKTAYMVALCWFSLIATKKLALLN